MKLSRRFNFQTFLDRLRSHSQEFVIFSLRQRRLLLIEVRGNNCYAIASMARSTSRVTSYKLVHGVQTEQATFFVQHFSIGYNFLAYHICKELQKSRNEQKWRLQWPRCVPRNDAVSLAGLASDQCSRDSLQSVVTSLCFVSWHVYVYPVTRLVERSTIRTKI